jgi:hypothetical protein
MAEFAAAGGHWVYPTLHGLDDGQVRAHVSITVGAAGEVQEGNVDLAVEAGGESLAQIARPGSDSPLMHISTRATTAIGFFTFSNPSNASPTRAIVTLNGESVAFDFGDPGPLPVA